MSAPAEPALPQANEELQAIYDRMADGILLADAQEACFLRANPAICRMLGYAESELLTMSVRDIHPAEDLSQVRAHFEALRDGRTTQAENVRCLRKDGSIFQAEVTATCVTYRDRPCLVGFFRDVTEQRRAEEARRESQEKFHTFVGQSAYGYAELDLQGNILFANQRAADMVAYPAEKIVGKYFGQFLPEADLPRALENLQQVLSQPDATLREYHARAKDGSLRVVQVNTVPMTKQGQVVGYQCYILDITAQKTAAEAVQKEQQLLRQLLELQERDRRLIAYEIHDGFAQQLTGALYNFEAFNRLRAEHPEKAQQSFDTALRMLRQSLADARRLIGGLRPPILDEFGIMAAIDYLICESRQRGEAAIEFSHQVQFDRLAPPLESALFRIVQECLANACRHSQSRTIRVELRQEGDRMGVDVRDWGIGFDPASLQEGRFGLQGIRERARLLGGRVTIDTAPGRGTHVCVELPLIEPVLP
jgi:PAS domain S-box-containing protein